MLMQASLTANPPHPSATKHSHPFMAGPSLQILLSGAIPASWQGPMLPDDSGTHTGDRGRRALGLFCIRVRPGLLHTQGPRHRREQVHRLHSLLRLALVRKG